MQATKDQTCCICWPSPFEPIDHWMDVGRYLNCEVTQLHNSLVGVSALEGGPYFLADATKLRWGTGKRLYYAIEWEGICVPVIAPTPVPGYSPPPRCGGTHWGTVIDATTGKFVVEGSA